MKLKNQLMIGFIIISFCVWIVAVLSLISIQNVEESYHSLEHQTVPVIIALNNIKYADTRIEKKITEEYFTNFEKNKSVTDLNNISIELESDLNSNMDLFDKSFKDYEKLILDHFPEEIGTLQEIRYSQERFENASIELIESRKQLLPESEILARKTKFKVSSDELFGVIESASIAENLEKEKRMQMYDDSMANTKKIVFFAALFSFLLAIVLSVLLSNEISTPLDKLNDLLIEVGKGKLDTRFDVKSKSEIGTLSDSFNTMIADLKKSKHDLISSNKFIETIIRSIGDMLIVLDAGSRIKFVNHHVIDNLGYAESELFGKSAGLIIKEFDGIINTINEKGVWKIEKNFISKNGKIIPASISGSMMLDESGKFQGTVFVARDITDQKEFIDAIMSSNEFSKTIINSMKDPLLIIDVNDFKIIDINDAFLKEFGDKREDIIMNQTCYKITHNSDKPCSGKDEPCPLIEIMKTGKSSTVEHLHHGKEGKIFYHEITASPLRDKNGNIIQIIHIARDITERKIYEERLKENEEKFRLTVESSNDAIILTDSDNRIFSFNSRAKTIFGYEDEEFIGRSFISLLPGRYKETFGYALEWFLSKDIDKLSDRSTIEMHGLRKNGTEFVFDISIASWKTTSGICRASVIRDITYRKQIEKEIVQKNIDLMVAEKIKTQFLSVVSHELKTPITPIKVQLQMILSGCFGEVNEKQKTGLEMVLRNTSRLDRLIGDILDISKLEGGVMKFDRQKANLNELARNAVETMKPKADDKNIKLIMKESTGMNKIPEIMIDIDRITQVLINLISNAIKFTAPGGSVDVEVLYSDENACVKVKDTGIGIKREDQERLFQPFVQIQSKDTSKADGTGLGLAISKGIVSSHGGKIWIESEYEKGSIFLFILPLKCETNEIKSEINLFEQV